MRPFNFDTLAVQAHNFAADERLTQAATPALTIVAVGIPPVILLSRAIASGRPGRRGEAGSETAAEKAVEKANLAERSEENTTELQSLMRISYAVFCLKKKRQKCTPIKKEQ